MSLIEPRQADTDELLERVIEIVEGARSLPLSSAVRLDRRDEVLDLLDEAVHRLPEETREARWMLKEKQEFLDRMQREGDDILGAARLRAERMVQRTEIVREANHTARRLLEEARDEARRLRLEAEDYCDDKLAEFEVVLGGILHTVAAGRVRLSAHPTPPRPRAGEGTDGADPLERTLGGSGAFFDQDHRR